MTITTQIVLSNGKKCTSVQEAMSYIEQRVNELHNTQSLLDSISEDLLDGAISDKEHKQLLDAIDSRIYDIRERYELLLDLAELRMGEKTNQ